MSDVAPPGPPVWCTLPSVEHLYMFQQRWPGKRPLGMPSGGARWKGLLLSAFSIIVWDRGLGWVRSGQRSRMLVRSLRRGKTLDDRIAGMSWIGIVGE